MFQGPFKRSIFMNGVIAAASGIYAIFAGITINVMYRNRQKNYVLMKTLTSILFLLIGLFAYHVTDDSFYLACLPGFILCFLGDVLLALAHEIDNRLKNPQFVLGVGSFLLAHVFFCCQFLLLLDWQIKWPTVISLIMVGITISCTLNPKYDYGSNKIPSIIYSFFVGLLCGLGLQLLMENPDNGMAVALGIGSVCFLASDYALSLKYFRIEKPRFLGLFVLVAYYGAMWLLSSAVLFQ